MALTRPRAHQLSGTSAKAAVRVVSESNVTLSGGAPATVDGVSLTLDDRILVTGQSTASQNGLYRCTVVGSGSNGTWVRSRDGSHDGTISAGMTTIVTEGSTYADTLWKLTTDGTITIGTTALAFSQHSGGGGTPGGSDTQVQFNDSGSFGGDAGLTYNKTTDSLTIVGTVTGGTLTDGTATITSGALSGATSITASGTVTGGTLAGTLSTVAQPNVTSVGTLSALTVAGDILNGQSDGVGNIGSSTVGFDTVHAIATSAQYADLAEKYTTDHDYEAGTVVVFGGNSEITQSTISHDRKVAGVISTNPAVKMNDGLDGQYLALQGRVPCKVIGPIEKGDLVVTSHVPGLGVKLDDTQYQPGCVIGKALESIEDQQEQVIEVVVGRL